MKSRLVLLILSTLIFALGVCADTPIGNGFSCQGDAILKGDKEVSFSKAKSNIAKTLEKLKSKLATATAKSKAGIKAKIKEANNSKTLLKACSSGNLDSTQVDPVFTDLASGSGTYSGTYSGTVSGFIPLSGEITVQFILEGTNFSAILSLSGNLGSTLNAKPLTFTNDVGGIGFPAQFFLTNTFIGDVTLSVTQDGHLTITNSNSSTGSVTFDGTFANKVITSTLSGSYSGISFQGGATLNRQ